MPRDPPSSSSTEQRSNATTRAKSVPRVGSCSPASSCLTWFQVRCASVATRFRVQPRVVRRATSCAAKVFATCRDVGRLRVAGGCGMSGTMANYIYEIQSRRTAKLDRYVRADRC